VELGPPTRATPQELAFGFGQVTLDEQIPMGEQRGALRCEPLFRAGRLLGCGRARAPFASFGLLGCEALAGAGHSPEDGFVHLGHDRKRPDVMRDVPEHLCEGHGRERRAIGRDLDEGQVACRQGRVQTPQQPPDVLVGGIVVSDVIEDAFVAAIIDCGEQTKGAVIELIGGHIS
jgi:hypothetical protein